MTIVEAARDLVSLIDAAGPPRSAAADKVFAQVLDNLRAAVEAHDAEVERLVQMATKTDAEV